MTTYDKASPVKISVIKSKRGGKHLYTIKVVDGASVIHTEEAFTMKERDSAVWRLSDLYEANDVELLNEADKVKFVCTEVPSIPCLEWVELEQYIKDEPRMVSLRIAQVVYEGIQQKKKSVKLFELSGTGRYIKVKRGGWLAGLQQARTYFEQQQEFSMCATIHDIEQELILSEEG